MTAFLVILGLWALWAIFNWLAPLSILAFAQPLSYGRIPAEIMFHANAKRVKYYVVANLARGYAFSTWLGWRHAVVLNKDFMQYGSPSQIRFVLAHELGHCALGHLKMRWLCVVTGAILLPQVRAYLKRQEDDADKYGEELSCVPRSVLGEHSAANDDTVPGPQGKYEWPEGSAGKQCLEMNDKRNVFLAAGDKARHSPDYLAKGVRLTPKAPVVKP